MKYLIAFLLLTMPCFALRIDPSSSSFELREKKRVDLFDFSGPFPQLENIDIDARRKKRVEMLLTGDYPLLQSVNYEGGFGSLMGKLTGHFPQLGLINVACHSAAMHLDLQGDWERDCEINIRGTTSEIVLKLPQDVSLVVNTRKSPTGKILCSEELSKKGWWGWLKKTYTKEVPDSEVTLTLNIEVTKGQIVLN